MESHAIPLLLGSFNNSKKPSIRSQYINKKHAVIPWNFMKMYTDRSNKGNAEIP